MAGLLPETPEYGEMQEQSSKSWRIDWEAGRLSGEIDGLEALGQALLLALSVPRFAHVIYSFDYGSELHTLVGRNREYAEAAAPALAEEAVRGDDRVREVKAGSFTASGDRLTGTITVTAEGGRISASVDTGERSGGYAGSGV